MFPHPRRTATPPLESTPCTRVLREAVGRTTRPRFRRSHPMTPPPRIDIEPLFAAPLAFVEHPDPASLNPALEALLLARSTDEYRNPTPSHIPQPETFESRFDMFRWPEAPVRALRDFMLGSVLRVVVDLNGYDEADANRLVEGLGEIGRGERA